jgi:hypothetical protein
MTQSPIISIPEEFNRILAIVHENGTPSGISQKTIAGIASGTIFHGRMPDHATTIKAACGLGLLASSRGRIQLTRRGQAFLALNEEVTYELAPGQAAFLMRECVLLDGYKEDARNLFRYLIRDKVRSTAYFDVTLWTPSNRELALIALLRRLGVLTVSDNKLILTEQYARESISLLSHKTLSLAVLEQLLAARSERAKEAEDWVVKYERERLTKAGHYIEAAAVARISGLDVAAGYDVESYNGSSSALVPDRFIEVKSTSSDQKSFYWSVNELNTARALREQYWIYHVRTFDAPLRTGQLTAIQNPARLLSLGKLRAIANEYYVTFS